MKKTLPQNKKTFVNVEYKTLSVIFRQTDKLKCLPSARRKESWKQQ